MDLDAYRTVRRGVRLRAHGRVLPPLRRAQGRLRDRADLRTPRGAVRPGSGRRAPGRRRCLAAGSEDRRRLTDAARLRRRGDFGQATKELEAELARQEARATIEVAGQTVGFRESAVVQANEPDARVGRRSSRRRLAIDGRAPQPASPRADRAPARRWLAARATEATASCAPTARASTWPACAAPDGRFAAPTEAQLPGGCSSPSCAVRSGSAGRAAPRRSAPVLPRRRARTGTSRRSGSSTACSRRLRGLGIDVAASTGVVLDVEPRPNKIPRAFCAPVRVPDEVYLVHRAGRRSRRLRGAVPRGRPYRALRARRPGAAVRVPLPRRQRDHRGVRVPVPAPGRGPGVAGTPARHRRRAMICAPTRAPQRLALPAPLLRQARLRARAPRRRRPARSALGALRGTARRARCDRVAARDVPVRRGSGLLLRLLSARLGTRDAPADVPARAFRLGVVRATRAGDALRALWREGQRRSPEELLGELTGSELDFDVLLDDLELRR